MQASAEPQAYYQYSEKLFQNQRSLGPETYANLADGLNVQADAIRKAATNRKYDPTVEAAKKEATDRGVRGTPTVFINGKQLQWSSVEYKPLRDAIEEARS